MVVWWRNLQGGWATAQKSWRSWTRDALEIMTMRSVWDQTPRSAGLHLWVGSCSGSRSTEITMQQLWREGSFVRRQDGDLGGRRGELPLWGALPELLCGCGERCGEVEASSQGGTGTTWRKSFDFSWGQEGHGVLWADLQADQWMGVGLCADLPGS